MSTPASTCWRTTSSIEALQAGLIGGLVVGLAGLDQLEELDELGRPDQAADMGGEDAVGAAGHAKPPTWLVLVGRPAVACRWRFEETAWQIRAKALNRCPWACRPCFVGAPLRASRKHQQSGTHSFWTSCGTSEGKGKRSLQFRQSRVLSKTAGAGTFRLNRQPAQTGEADFGPSNRVGDRFEPLDLERSNPRQRQGTQSSSLPPHVASDRDGRCNRRLDVPERREPPTGESLWNERQKPSR